VSSSEHYVSSSAPDRAKTFSGCCRCPEGPGGSRLPGGPPLAPAARRSRRILHRFPSGPNRKKRRADLAPLPAPLVRSFCAPQRKKQKKKKKKQTTKTSSLHSPPPSPTFPSLLSQSPPFSAGPRRLARPSYLRSDPPRSDFLCLSRPLYYCPRPFSPSNPRPRPLGFGLPCGPGAGGGLPAQTYGDPSAQLTVVAYR